MRFGFGDFDFFSANDGIGAIVGEYKGDLPFQVRGQVGGAWCHAIPPALIELERVRWERELGAALTAFDEYAPNIEKPVDWESSGRVQGALGALEYFSGKSETREKEASTRVLTAGRKQWSIYLDLLRQRQKNLPPPGTWASVNELVEVRVVGLDCQVGTKIIPICNPALELRFKKDATEPECEHSARFLKHWVKCRWLTIGAKRQIP
ncbi:MAG: hypothetical protein IPK82_02945 [Polyangiaceae bacterium]|nr:hypothetical protein [Polyangiaceae bacterium]